MSCPAKSKKPNVPQSSVSSRTQSSFIGQTRQNNKVFATASVSQDQAPLQLTSPCDNTLKTQHTQKNESETSTPPTPTKRPSSPLIAYVQSMSPVKHSKKGSLLYFNLNLQSASARHPAVCFSRSKQSFLHDRAATVQPKNNARARSGARRQKFDYLPFDVRVNIGLNLSVFCVWDRRTCMLHIFFA